MPFCRFPAPGWPAPIFRRSSGTSAGAAQALKGTRVTVAGTAHSAAIGASVRALAIADNSAMTEDARATGFVR